MNFSPLIFLSLGWFSGALGAEITSAAAPAAANTPSSGGAALQSVAPGQVILAVPDLGNEAILLNENGGVVHAWKSKFGNAGGARLQPDGSLLHVVAMPLEKSFQVPGVIGGGLEILEADGSVRWRFWNAVSEHMTFGDALMLPNGNVLSLVLEWKSREEAEKAGRDPASLTDSGLLVPGLMEVKPKGLSGGVPVWRWSLWDHLYQQRHPALANYSHPNAKEGCVDINTLPNLKGSRWLAPEALDFHVGDSLIAVTVRQLGEVWLVRHAGSKDSGTEGPDAGILQRLGRGSEASSPPPTFIGANWQADGSSLKILKRDGSVVEGRRLPAEPPEFIVHEAPLSVFKKPAGDAGARMVAKAAAPLEGGDWVFASGFGSSILRIGAGGSVRWTVANDRGKSKFFKHQPGEEESCCGGGTPASNRAGVKEAGKEKESFEAAPISRLRSYPRHYLALAPNDGVQSPQ